MDPLRAAARRAQRYRAEQAARLAGTTPKPDRRAQLQIAEDIILGVSREYGINVTTILSRSRDREVVNARQEAMRRVVDGTTPSVSVVGRLFNRDRTTVIHAIRKEQ